MTEQTPQPGQSLTEADHFAPDGVTPRISDPEKAYFLAHSNAKKYEDASAASRARLESIVTGNNEILEVNKTDGTGKIHYINRDYRENVEMPDGGRLTGNVWHRETSVNALTQTAENIQRNNEKADKTYEAAAIIYDALKKTKR